MGNGKIVSKEGMGLDFSNPVLTCTTEVLRSNIERLLEDHDTFASNCKRLHKSLGEAGGLEKAYKCIEDYVASFKGHDRTVLEHDQFKKKDSHNVDLNNCRSESFERNVPA